MLITKPLGLANVRFAPDRGSVQNLTLPARSSSGNNFMNDSPFNLLFRKMTKIGSPRAIIKLVCAEKSGFMRISAQSYAVLVLTFGLGL